jgi:SAM-dependent methyltransferase
MYGREYGTLGGGPYEIKDPKDSKRIVRYLKKTPPGIFVDFGCGDGTVLRAVQDAGWRAIGVEIDPEVAREVAVRTGLEVISRLEGTIEPQSVDVVNLGDVIEHLTDAAGQLGQILSILRPGGLLIAQGPLEANKNLFTFGLRIARTLRPRPATIPPYHVILATAKGQRTLFDRLGLETIEFDITEVDWPAPSRITIPDLTSPRHLVLFVVRQASKLLTALTSADWGNRYFFIGRVQGASPPRSVKDLWPTAGSVSTEL